MAIEIERKFLLTSDDWRNHIDTRIEMCQGYLSRNAQSMVRIRITKDKAILCIKSTRDGIHRLEYEYSIPMVDAHEMMQQIAHRPLIEKTRHIVPWGRHRWEIDEFHGDNEGLVVAEIELSAAEEKFEQPPWLGREVSADERYYNASLSKLPYTEWKDQA